MTEALTELARAVDEAVAATPGVERLFAAGVRAGVGASIAETAPLSSVARRLDSYEATVSIGAEGGPAGSVARAAATAAAAALPPGARVTVRVSRVVPARVE